MLRSTRVSILGRSYPLRVRPEDEAAMRRIAAFVDARMRKVRDQLPDRPELTTAVITALSIAEELFRINERGSVPAGEMNERLDEMVARLDEVLSAGDGPVDGNHDGR